METDGETSTILAIFSNLCVPASGSGVLEAGMEMELGSTHTKGATCEARVTFGI